MGVVQKAKKFVNKSLPLCLGLSFELSQADAGNQAERDLCDGEWPLESYYRKL